MHDAAERSIGRKPHRRGGGFTVTPSEADTASQPADAQSAENAGSQENPPQPNNEPEDGPEAADIDLVDPVADASASATEEDPTEDNATAGDGSNLTLPAAMERINEDVMLTTPVAQQETTRTYFLAQTLESTKTIPVVSANLPLDTGATEDAIDPVESENGESGEDEGGEDSDESDPPNSIIAADSTVIGSFTYRGITYAVEPGGETVAIVAADYSKLPEDFIEAKAIVLPSMVTPDGIDYYSVTRIADYAFANLNSNEAGIDAITVPATVAEIGDNAFTDFNTLQYILVSEDNQQYSQYDGCLYDKPQTRLLLIPEGRLGAVRVPSTATTIPEDVSSHCASLTSLIVEPGSAAHQLLTGDSEIHRRIADKNIAVLTDDDLGLDDTSFDPSIYESLISSESETTSLSAPLSVMSISKYAATGTYPLKPSGNKNDLELYLKNETGKSIYLNATDVTIKDSAHDLSNRVFPELSGKAVQQLANGSSATLYIANTSWCYDKAVLYTADRGVCGGFYSSNQKNWRIQTVGASYTQNGELEQITSLKDSAGNAVPHGTELTFGATYIIADIGYRSVTWSEANLTWKVAPNSKVSTSSSYAGALPTPVKSGYVFGGWYTGSGGTGTQVTADTVVTGNVTFYPKWLSYITVSWSTYTGTGSTASSVASWSVLEGNKLSQAVNYPGALPSPTAWDSDFGGWYTGSGGTGTAVSADTVITANVTFYGKWTLHKNTLTVNPNGGKLNNSTNNATYSMTMRSFDNAVTIESFTRDGYTFNGLYSASSGGEQMWSASGAKASAVRGSSWWGEVNSNVGWRCWNDVTAYAQWTANTYTVTFDKQSGTGGSDSATVTYAKAFASNISIPSRSRYNFAGYFAGTGGTGTQYFYASGAPTANVWNTAGNGTLYAHWTVAQWSLTIDANGGTVYEGSTNRGSSYTYDAYVGSNYTTAYGSNNNFFIHSYRNGASNYSTFTASRPGYTQTGWVCSNGLTATTAGINPTGDGQKFTASWTANQYTITLDGNGGKINNSVSTQVLDNPKVTFGLGSWGCIAGYPSYRAGYTFDGYTATKDGVDYVYGADGWLKNDGTYWKNGVWNYAGDKTFYAHWTANTYTVRYNGNGGKVSGTNATTATSSHTYDTDKSLSANPFNVPPTGKHFLKWNTNSAGTGTSYTETQSVKNLTTTNGATVDLHAIWEWNTYTVTYNPNTGSGNAYTSNHTYSTAQNLTNNKFTAPKGQHFVGWNTQADGKGTSYTETQSVNNLTATNKGNVNLYAQWDNNVYKVSFDANGGTGGITGPIDVTYSLAMPTLTGDWKPSLGGYEFNGWWDADAKTGGNQYYTPNGTSANSWDKTDGATLYARWSRLPFHAITLNDARLRTTDKSIWYWPSHGYTPDDPNDFPTDGTRDHEIKIVKASDANPSIVTPAVFDDDYEFLGWFDKKQGEEGAVQKIDANGNLLTDEVITDATTWYAHWTRHGSTVELKAEYGEGMVVEDIVEGTKEIAHVAFEKDFATLLDGSTVSEIEKTPTRVGYSFMGYYTKPNPELSTDDVKEGRFDGELWINVDGELKNEAWAAEGEEPVDATWPSEKYWQEEFGLTDEEPTNTVVLYAAWQLDDCVVEFDTESNLKANTERVFVPEGSTALHERIWHYNKNMIDTLPVPGEGSFSRNGYDFDGWYYVNVEGDEVRISDRDGIPNAEVLSPWKDDAKKVTLFAYWIPRTYALQFHPSFPDVEGVEQVYEGEKLIEGIDYDDELTLVSPDFGAYDFAGWYVGEPDDLGGWKASDVPFADWTLRDGTEVEGEHTTDVTKQSDDTYVGRFTPHDPLVGQTYVADAEEPAIIHVVAKWENPVDRYFTLYVGKPGGGEDALRRQDDARVYPFATPISFPETWGPGREAGWEFEGWIEVGSDDATDEENAQAALDAIERGDTFEGIGGVTKIDPKVTRSSYRNLHYVAKWTICPMSVTLVSEENEEGTYVKATDTMSYPKEEGTLLSWDEVATTEGSYKAVYDVRDKSFTLPDLTRRGYDFKGWRLKDGDGHVWPRVKIDPAEQATWDKTQYHLTYEPVFEEITYRIVLKANNKDPYTGELEDQTFERTYTEEFTFPYPVALRTGGVFSAWATKSEEPYMEDPDYLEFFQAKTYPMSPGTDDNGGATFCLTDLTTDEERTITLYAIYNAPFNVTVPLVANMAIDTETGDVVAGKTRLWDDKEGVTYTVESLRYEPVKDVATGQVPFQGAYEVYFSIYPGLSFQNDADAYYFLQKSKVGDKGAVTYADKEKDGEDTTVEPILVKLGGTDATPKLFTRTSLSNDPDEVTLDSKTGDTYGFYSFSKDKPLDVYYGIHFADSATWKDTLKRFSFKENATTWTLPKNDAGNQTDTTNGRKLGWSSDRVDIAKVRYTLSMTKTVPESTE